MTKRGAGADWLTPQPIIHMVEDVFEQKIWLDPCAEVPADYNFNVSKLLHVDYEFNVSAVSHFTQLDNGLVQEWWATSCFVSPPPDALHQWVKKAVIEFGAGRCDQLILLLPCSPDMSWLRSVARYPLSMLTEQYDSDATLIAIGMGVDLSKFMRIFGGAFGSVYWPAPGAG